MGKEFDKKTLDELIPKIVLRVFERVFSVKPVQDVEIKEREIIEYDSKMRLFPMEKFNGPVYIAVSNLFLSQRDLEQEMSVGTIALFVKEDVIEKLIKGFGHLSRDAENEEIVMGDCATLLREITKEVKESLSSLNYPELMSSDPVKYKNNIPDGVPFNYSLFKKQEFIFSFWGQKSIAIEICLTILPKK